MQMTLMSIFFHPELSCELQTHGCKLPSGYFNLDVQQHLKLNMSQIGLLVSIPESASPMFPIPVNSVPVY